MKNPATNRWRSLGEIGAEGSEGQGWDATHGIGRLTIVYRGRYTWEGRVGSSEMWRAWAEIQLGEGAAVKLECHYSINSREEAEKAARRQYFFLAKWITKTAARLAKEAPR